MWRQESFNWFLILTQEFLLGWIFSNQARFRFRFKSILHFSLPHGCDGKTSSHKFSERTECTCFLCVFWNVALKYLKINETKVSAEKWKIEGRGFAPHFFRKNWRVVQFLCLMKSHLLVNSSYLELVVHQTEIKERLLLVSPPNWNIFMDLH